MTSSGNFVCLVTILVFSLCVVISAAEEDIAGNQVPVSNENPKSVPPKNRFIDIIAPFVRVGVFGASGVGVQAPFTSVMVGRVPGSLSSGLHINVPFFKMNLGGPKE